MTYPIADSVSHLRTELVGTYRTDRETFGKEDGGVHLGVPERFAIVGRYSSCL